MKKKLICAAMAAALAGSLMINVYADSVSTPAMPEPTAAVEQIAEKSDDGEVLVISAAPESYRIFINGKQLALKDQKLFTEKDSKGNTVLMVPLRAISEALGFTVEWKSGEAYVDDGQMHTTVTIGKDNYVAVTSIKDAVGMTAPFSLGAAPEIVANRTYVPLQLFEILMGNVEGMFSLDGTDVKINTKAAESGDSTQTPNPFTEYKTLEEASKASGIAFTVPEKLPAGYSADYVSAIKGELIQISYKNAKDSEILLRKGTGTDDISGDYNSYKTSEKVKINGHEVTLKGNDGKVFVAVWNDGTNSYAIDMTGTGLDKSTVTDMVSAIK